MSLRAFSSRLGRNTLSSVQFRRCTCSLFLSSHIAVLLGPCRFPLESHSTSARPLSTQIGGPCAHNGIVASSVDPLSIFLDQLDQACNGKSIVQVRDTCRNYLSSRISVESRSTDPETRETRKQLLGRSLCLLSSSGDPEDMKLVGYLIRHMHESWGMIFEAAFYNDVLEILTSSDRLVSALKWLAEIPDRPGNLVPLRQQWDRFLLQCKSSHNANLILSSLDIMRRTGCPPNADTYWFVFETLLHGGAFPHFAQVQEIVDDMKRDNVPFTRAILDLLVEGYENAGSTTLIAEVTQLYETLRGPDNNLDPHTGIDRNRMLGRAAAQDKVGAVRLLNKYISKGFRPTRGTLLAVSEAARRVSDLVFWEKKLGMEADADIWAIVIQNAAFAGSATDRYNAMEAYRTIERRSIKKTVDMFYPLLRAVCTTSDRAPDDSVIDLSLGYLKEFLLNSEPSAHRKSLPAYLHLLRAVTMSRNTRKYLPIAMTLVEDMQTRRVPLDPITTTSIVIMIMNCCQTSAEAYEIYKKLHRTTGGQYALDQKGYEAVVNNFCKRSFQPWDSEAAMYYFDMLKDMRSAGHPIRPQIYHNVLRRLEHLITSLRPAEEDARLKLLGTIRRIHEVITLDGSLVPDIALWNQLMDTYQRLDCFREAHQLWQTMFLAGDFDNETVRIILDACSRECEDGKTAEIYRKLHDRRFKFDLRNWHNWLQRLCRAGRLDDAVKVMCLEMSQMTTAQPTEETVRIVLRYASLSNQEDEVRSRVRRYLPHLWSTLPNSIREETQ